MTRVFGGLLTVYSTDLYEIWYTYFHSNPDIRCWEDVWLILQYKIDYKDTYTFTISVKN